VDDADEMEAAIKRWQALIRQDKNTAVWARMVEGRPRWNRDAKKSEFEARCTRIREL
jgi:hypothetical protein